MICIQHWIVQFRVLKLELRYEVPLIVVQFVAYVLIDFNISYQIQDYDMVIKTTTTIIIIITIILHVALHKNNAIRI